MMINKMFPTIVGMRIRAMIDNLPEIWLSDFDELIKQSNKQVDNINKLIENSKRLAEELKLEQNPGYECEALKQHNALINSLDMS